MIAAATSGLMSRLRGARRRAAAEPALRRREAVAAGAVERGAVEVGAAGLDHPGGRLGGGQVELEHADLLEDAGEAGALAGAAGVTALAAQQRGELLAGQRRRPAQRAVEDHEVVARRERAAGDGEREV